MPLTGNDLMVYFDRNTPVYDESQTPEAEKRKRPPRRRRWRWLLAGLATLILLVILAQVTEFLMLFVPLLS